MSAAKTDLEKATEATIKELRELTGEEIATPEMIKRQLACELSLIVAQIMEEWENE